MESPKIKRFLLIFLFVSLIVLLLSMTAYAAPGGIIAKSLVKTFWGRIFLAIVGIILLPLILYVYIKEQMAINRARKALRRLSSVNSCFRWTVLNQRAREVVAQVYSAWKKADIERASQWMTGWYWQNQKMTVLDEWESEGFSNICKLNKINYIKPLYVEYDENGAKDAAGSRVVLLMEVNLQDYLIHEQSGKIVEGDKKNKDLEAIWTLIMEDGNWKLTLIEAGAQSLSYAKMINDLSTAQAYLSANA